MEGWRLGLRANGRFVTVLGKKKYRTWGEQRSLKYSLQLRNVIVTMIEFFVAPGITESNDHSLYL